jgi:hypothetical protein
MPKVWRKSRRSEELLHLSLITWRNMSRARKLIKPTPFITQGLVTEVLFFRECYETVTLFTDIFAILMKLKRIFLPYFKHSLKG